MPANLDPYLRAALLDLVDGDRDLALDTRAIADAIADTRAPLDDADDARGAAILAGACANLASLARDLAAIARERVALAVADPLVDSDLFGDLDDALATAERDAESARAAVRSLLSE